MPAFRSTVRRRPRRVAPRRRSTRWAPPGFSPASGVTIDLATFGDTFSETTLKPWWRDGAVVYPDPSRTALTTAGSGLIFEPVPGTYSEALGAYPFDFTGKSATFDIAINESLLVLSATAYFDLALITWPWVGGFGAYISRVQFYHDGSEWVFHVQLNNGGTTQVFSATIPDWRFIRMSSDPVAPTTVTVYRSPDGYNWTTVLSAVNNTADITAATFYAYSDIYDANVPATVASATGTAHNATATAT